MHHKHGWGEKVCWKVQMQVWIVNESRIVGREKRIDM